MSEFLTMQDLVAHLRTLRQDAKLSQSALGELCGLTQQYINAVENGQRIPTFETAATIADALGVTLTLKTK